MCLKRIKIKYTQSNKWFILYLDHSLPCENTWWLLWMVASLFHTVTFQPCDSCVPFIQTNRSTLCHSMPGYGSYSPGLHRSIYYILVWLWNVVQQHNTAQFSVFEAIYDCWESTLLSVFFFECFICFAEFFVLFLLVCCFVFTMIWHLTFS